MWEATGALTKETCIENYSVHFALLGTLKLSQTSPDVPNSEAGAQPHKDLPNANSQQQVTSRSVSSVSLYEALCVGLKECMHCVLFYSLVVAGCVFLFAQRCSGG